MIGLMSIADYGKHFPDNKVEVTKNFTGYAIITEGGRLLEYHSTRSECIRRLEQAGYAPLYANYFKKGINHKVKRTA